MMLVMAGTRPAMTDNSSFSRGFGVNRQRVDAAGQFTRKNTVYEAVAFDPGLIFERIRHNIDPVVSLPAFTMAHMPGVQVRFVIHLEALRG
jgi:hypothetical protein